MRGAGGAGPVPVSSVQRRKRPAACGVRGGTGWPAEAQVAEVGPCGFAGALGRRGPC